MVLEDLKGVEKFYSMEQVGTAIGAFANRALCVNAGGSPKKPVSSFNFNSLVSCNSYAELLKKLTMYFKHVVSSMELERDKEYLNALDHAIRWLDAHKEEPFDSNINMHILAAYNHVPVRK